MVYSLTGGKQTINSPDCLLSTGGGTQTLLSLIWLFMRNQNLKPVRVKSPKSGDEHFAFCPVFFIYFFSSHLANLQ